MQVSLLLFSYIPCVLLFFLPRSQPRIKRPGAGTNTQEEDRSKEHRIIRPPFVSHAPESILEEDRYFRRRDGHAHVDDEWNCGQARPKAQKEEEPAADLDEADKRGHDLRSRNSDLGEATDTQGGGEKKLLDPFRKKHPTDHQANQEHRGRSVGLQSVMERWHAYLSFFFKQFPEELANLLLRDLQRFPSCRGRSIH